MDTDGDAPPRRLSGDLSTVLAAVQSIVPSGAPVLMDTTGVGLAAAQYLAQLGRRVHGYTIRPIRPIRP